MGGVSGKLAFAASEDAKETNELPVVQEVAPDFAADDKKPAETAHVASSEPALKTEDSSSESAEETKKPEEELVQVENPAAESEESKEEEAGAGNEESEAQAEESPDAEQEEVQEKKRPPITVEDIKTAPFDIRFPTTNQTKHCYTRYNEFYKCQKERGQGAPECEKYRRYYRSLCPSEWIEKWEEERELGIFPGPY